MMEPVIDIGEAADILFMHRDTASRYTRPGKNGEPPILDTVQVGSVRKVTLASVERYQRLFHSLPWSLSERAFIIDEARMEEGK